MITSPPTGICKSCGDDAYDNHDVCDNCIEMMSALDDFENDRSADGDRFDPIDYLYESKKENQ